MIRTIIKYATVVAVSVLAGILIVALVGCSSDGSNEPIVTGDDTPPIVDPDDPHGPVVASLITAEGIKFYDGESIWLWRAGAGERAESRVYANGNTLYALDAEGSTVKSRTIITEPDRIRIDLSSGSSSTLKAAAKSDPIELADADIWIVETLSADEAMALGALPKPYTRIWSNSDEYGDWMSRQYETDELTIHKGNIFARTTPGGAWVHINGSMSRIHTVIGDGFVIYDFDPDIRTAVIDGVDVSWSYNFMNGAKQWLRSGSKWYSHNGYTWDGSTLAEHGSAMWDWRSYGNVVITAGTHYENGEDVLYFIQCATGHVIRYVPSVNQYTEFVRLYTGDGQTETGLFYKALLKPVIIDDGLFFIFDSTTFRYDFTTGLTSPFATGISEVMEY